jgi:hypothetical protein
MASFLQTDRNRGSGLSSKLSGKKKGRQRGGTLTPYWCTGGLVHDASDLGDEGPRQLGIYSLSATKQSFLGASKRYTPFFMGKIVDVSPQSGMHRLHRYRHGNGSPPDVGSTGRICAAHVGRGHPWRLAFITPIEIGAAKFDDALQIIEEQGEMVILGECRRRFMRRL